MIITSAAQPVRMEIDSSPIGTPDDLATPSKAVQVFHNAISPVASNDHFSGPIADKVATIKQALKDKDIASIIKFGKSRGWRDRRGLHSFNLETRQLIFTCLLLEFQELSFLEKIDFEFKNILSQETLLKQAIFYYKKSPGNAEVRNCLFLILKRYKDHAWIQEGLLYVLETAAKFKQENFQKKLLLTFPQIKPFLMPKHATIVLPALEARYPNEESLLQHFPLFRPTWESVRTKLEERMMETFLAQHGIQELPDLSESD